MTQTVITPLEYIQRVRQITKGCMDEYYKQVESHGRKLGKYLDAIERRTEMRERNRTLLENKIKFHFQKKEYFQNKIDLIQSRLQTLRETYTYDTDNQIPEAEIKQEPREEMEENEDTEENGRDEIKAEAVKREIKDEPISLPNQIKSEPSA